MRESVLVQVPGPLSPFAVGFRDRLQVWGYAPGSQTVHLRLMAELSRWLDERGLDGSILSAAVLDEFVGRRRTGPPGARPVRSRRSPLLEYLREIGATARPVSQVDGPLEALLVDYGAYLIGERGLAATTVQRHCDLVRPFLVGQGAAGLDLTALVAGDVIAFMRGRCGCASPATVQRTGTALRSLLRFLHLQGVISSSLVGAVPAAANWKLAGLPKYLAPGQVAALLASCDQDTEVGRRDLAVLTLLVRLGLRAGEVAALALEDIDWRRGEITVRGKGDRRERLPLPSDVGEAVVAYLSGSRPAAATGREVFVGTRAPHRALTRGAVTQLVARASRRAGLGTIYAHRLRHTAATTMLHAGASLPEIGQVLRHRHALTTAGYANPRELHQTGENLQVA
ncbi:tyrosine-type recombinase/integrase [Pseudonocardia saturnea]